MTQQTPTTTTTTTTPILQFLNEYYVQYESVIMAKCNNATLYLDILKIGRFVRRALLQRQCVQSSRVWDLARTQRRCGWLGG